MAKFLLKTLEGSTYTPPPPIGIFPDVTDSFQAVVEEIARRGISTGCGGGNFCPGDPVTRDAMAKFLTKTWGFTVAVTPAGTKRYFFYSPEMSLLSDSDYSTNYHPQLFSEHFWAGGAPVAEVDTGGATHWTMTDHLGTPILQTSSDASVYWRVEHEPYGRVFVLRQGADIHQPLRLPGQEAEQIPATGINGATEKSYNIFRWYRPNWGRYTRADKLRLRPLQLLGIVQTAPNPYQYARNNPLVYTDPPKAYSNRPTRPLSQLKTAISAVTKAAATEIPLSNGAARRPLTMPAAGRRISRVCESEYSGCLACKDVEDPGYQEHAGRCTGYKLLCLGGQAVAECPKKK